MSVSTSASSSLQNGFSPGFCEDSQAVTSCTVTLSFSCSCGRQNHHCWRQSRRLWCRQWHGRRSMCGWRRKHRRRQLWSGRRDIQRRLLLWQWKNVQLWRWQLRYWRRILLRPEMCHNHNGQIFRCKILSPDLSPSKERSIRSISRPQPAAQPLASRTGIQQRNELFPS